MGRGGGADSFHTHRVRRFFAGVLTFAVSWLTRLLMVCALSARSEWK